VTWAGAASRPTGVVVSVIMGDAALVIMAGVVVRLRDLPGGGSGSSVRVEEGEEEEDDAITKCERCRAALDPFFLSIADGHLPED